jgi:cytochrome c-type biogenesis protein CcmH/NrfF
VSVTVPDVAPFFYETADVTVNGLGAAGDADPPVEVATASANFWAIPWTTLAVLLLGGAIAAGVIRSRRAPRQGPGQPASESTSSHLVSASSSSSES